MIIEHKNTIVDVSSDKWVIIYNDETLKLLTEPFQSCGSYTCADTLVVADTLEECRAYITEKKLINPSVVEESHHEDDL